MSECPEVKLFEKITSGWNGLPYIKCSKVFLFPATDFVLFCLFALRQKTFRFFTHQLKMDLWDFANETTRLSQESGPEDRFPNNSEDLLPGCPHFQCQLGLISYNLIDEGLYLYLHLYLYLYLSIYIYIHNKTHSFQGKEDTTCGIFYGLTFPEFRENARLDSRV